MRIRERPYVEHKPSAARSHMECDKCVGNFGSGHQALSVTQSVLGLAESHKRCLRCSTKVLEVLQGESCIV